MSDPFTGYARGWFVVALSDDLGPGDVKPLKYFGRDLVAYRGQDGKVRILDAHCPHLGAHLGVGGTVADNCIRCPFHAWRFDGEGQCVEILYADKIPSRAQVGAWPVDELNGLIFVWHARNGEAPDYRIPPLPQYDHDEWTPWFTNIRTIQTHPKELMENVADKAHFPTVHNTEIDRFDNEFDGHIAVQRTEGTAYPRAGGTDSFKLTATYYGPSYQITEMASDVMPSVLVNCHAPIDERTLHLRFGVMLKKIMSDDKMARFAEMYVKNLQVGFGEDVQIWEHKLYRERPMLCDGDGAIGKLRKWYRQFYQ